MIGVDLANLPEGIRFEEADSCDVSAMNRLTHGSDVINYCAAIATEGPTVFRLPSMGTLPGLGGEVINIWPDEETVSINELALILAESLGFALDPNNVAARTPRMRDPRGARQTRRDGFSTTRAIPRSAKWPTTGAIS